MSAPSSIRVGLAAPQEILRVGLRTVFGRADSDRFLVVAWEADQLEDAHPARQRAVEVVVMVGDFPTDGTVAMAARWTAVGAGVVVMREDWPAHLFPALMKCGVRAFLTPDLPGRRVVEAVEAVHHGGLVIGSPAVQGSRSLRDPESENPIERLSSAEWRVFELVAQGLTNRAVADVLELSEKTVKNHVSRILAKLGARRRAEAAARFVQYAEGRAGSDITTASARTPSHRIP